MDAILYVCVQTNSDAAVEETELLLEASVIKSQVGLTSFFLLSL